jgi:hypothetical protein
VESVKSELVEEGAWIQTKVVAQIDQLAQSRLAVQQGVLEHVKGDTGGASAFMTNLVGRNVSDVMQAVINDRR